MNERDAGKLKEKFGRLFKNHGQNFGCLNPECNSKRPIGSHSISRTFLREIEENGHVYIYHKNSENPDFHVPEPSSRASKFKGFCSRCDNSLFQPFEKQSLQLTKEHLFLLAFRSIAKEYHTKRSIVEFYEHEVPAACRVGLHIQQELVRFSYMKRMYEEACTALTNRNYGVFSHQVFIFQGSPVYLASSIMMPDILPSNRRVQIANWQPFVVNWIPFQNKLTCIIGYSKAGAQKPKKFCSAFKNLDPAHVCLAQLVMTLDNIENIVFKPSFLDSLTNFEKRYLHKVFFGFTDPLSLLTYPKFGKFGHFGILPKLCDVTCI